MKPAGQGMFLSGLFAGGGRMNGTLIVPLIEKVDVTEPVRRHG